MVTLKATFLEKNDRLLGVRGGRRGDPLPAFLGICGTQDFDLCSLKRKINMENNLSIIFQLKLPKQPQNVTICLKKKTLFAVLKYLYHYEIKNQPDC